MSNRNKKIENDIRVAITNTTPDVLQNILSDCKDKKGVVIPMTNTNNKKNMTIKLVASAAAIILVMAGVFGFVGYKRTTTVDSIIGFDVNPSIELKINTSEKVIDVNAINEDAVAIIGTMDLKGSKLDVAVHALIGSMLEKGYITELQNSILVTVKNKNDKKSTLLEEKLSKEIENLLKESSIDAAILAQDGNSDKDLEKLAVENNISIGKAKLISQIAAKDATQDVSKLAKLSINDLNLLAASKNIALDNTVSTGTASSKKYIGNEKATAIALASAKTSADKVSNLFVEFDNDDGKMIYEVEFVSGSIKYDFDIEAITGEIVHTQKEGANSDTQDDKNPTESDDPSKPEDKEEEEDNNNTDKNDQDNDPGNTNENQDDEDEPSTEVVAPNKIGENKAKQLAFTHAGIKASDIKDIKIKIDFDNNKEYYELTFTTEKAEFDYKIDAVTGAFVQSDKTLIEEPDKAEPDNGKEEEDNNQEPPEVDDDTDTD
ncbi:MAG: PepSY domain-containing protein [Clostridia bacterium]